MALSLPAPLCHPERSEGPLRPQERSLAALGMTVSAHANDISIRYRYPIYHIFDVWGCPTHLAPMTAALAASLALLMIFTALLSGVFGMAGGLILVGVLLVLMPLPQAMVLHAVTQMASNG